MSQPLCRLNKWPVSLKVLATCIIVTFLLGYAVSLIKVYDISHFSIREAIIYYRGATDSVDASLYLPKSYKTILSTTHIHTMTQPLLFGLLGLIFAFSYLSEKRKSFFILLGFMALVVSNISPWLVRYVSWSMIFSFILSQVAIAISLLLMSLTSLYDLWFSKND